MVANTSRTTAPSRSASGEELWIRGSLTKDFKEFLQSLTAHDVKFLVIGGHAVAYNGYPRATSDLDVWIAVDQENAAKVVGALRGFGFDLPDLDAALFLQENRVIRMGIAPNRIEIRPELTA